ncbi:aldehyde dehydrogenase family protein [Gordonia sp. GONU]|uniref:aldehyde dehydrogenase family protein n=1 Tax=Gordonia sp. GONU TaxID=2972949 RepID=UPI0021AB9E52|nr:aldehyde dehydrogenase family protein [Gordonia sp. GONU]MCR8899858.1 aldehyde dehydrogenase family protein [Gordonia sp. GONU]
MQFRREYDEFFIDGDWRKADAQEQFRVISPGTGKQIGHVPAASIADIDAAVEAARRAFYETDWADRPVEERARLCEALASALYENREQIAELLVDELGCTRMLADVYQAVAPTLHWNYNAALGRQYPFTEVRTADLGPLAGGSAGGMVMPYETQSLTVKKPAGVVATLVAFNFSMPGTAQKVAPAIVAGCTVVIKVPEPNPLAVFAMGELIKQVGFPPGVINIVAAGAESSNHLVTHPDVDMVSFTGSLAVGSKIGEACGALIRPAVLELGGKAAAIVLDDADLDTVIPTLVTVGFVPSSGQSCTLQSRFLVPRAKHDEIVDRLVAALGDLKIGDPHDPETAIGPVITEKHRDTILGFIERAKADGAKVAFGGGVPAELTEGWYVEPTLLTNVARDSEIAQEEVFGPVVVVLPYDTEEEAIELANDTKYGLSSSVYTSDVAYGFEFGRKIRTGTFAVNTYAADFNSAFGGFKKSGIGREHGPAGLEEYLRPQTIAIDPSQKLPESVVKSADKVSEGVGL